MTLIELKEKISESSNIEWLQKYKVELNYPQINFKLSLQGVVAIYEFILKQLEGFDKLGNLPRELIEIKKAFSSTKTRIIDLIEQNQFNDHTWNSNLAPVINNNPKIFLHDSPETEFLIRVNHENPKFFNGAYEYLNGNTQHATNKEYMTGYLLAYEFTSKDFSLIAERKEAEKKSISSIRSDFQKKLSEAESEVVEFFSKSNQKFNESAEQIDKVKFQKSNTFDVWFKKTADDFSKFNSESFQRIKEFEELYKAKLKLEAPAKYWNDRATKLRKEGYRWLVALIVSILMAVGILVWVLDEVSKGTLSQIFQNTGTSIKWSVALITIISFLAFFIRTFSKLTFSSFHLVRDAEEREQLTYVYLALQKEKGVDQTERHLIMQSLFSRADTGLLKDEGSPTMPGNIADQLIRK